MSGCGGCFGLLPRLGRRWRVLRLRRARRGCILVIWVKFCMLALGILGDIDERFTSIFTDVLPAIRREFADATEVLLARVLELLREPYVGTVHHKGIGRAGYMFLVATAAVSRAAGSGVAAKQDVHGGAVLNDVVGDRVELFCGVRATVWTLRHRASTTTAQSCDRCGRPNTHVGALCDRGNEPEGGDGLRDGGNGNGEECKRGKSNRLRGIGNVAEQVTISAFTETEVIAESITCVRS